MKELRLASEDLIKSVLPSAATKDDVSPLPLSSIPETLYLLIDQKLAESSEEHAVHLTASSSTVLIKGSELKSYLESLAQGGEVRVTDFTQVKAEPRAPAPAAWVSL